MNVIALKNHNELIESSGEAQINRGLYFYNIQKEE